MRVLLIAPRFYDYDKQIKEEIEKQGNDVDLYCEYKEKYFIFTRFIPKSWKVKRNLAIQKKILKQTENTKYDIVLIIVGRFICEEFIKELKQQQTKACFVLYLWDNVDRCESFVYINKYFNKIYSFDRNDCSTKNFAFLPLFYTNDFNFRPEIDKTISVYGAFFAHSDRISIVQKVAEQIQNGYFFFYFASKIQLLKYKFLTKKTDSTYQIHVKNFSMSKKENILNMQRAKCVLDIQHPTQNGLTIRTIEAIGCQNKLITTNTDIVNYDFYNKNNIIVIDRKNPIIPREFIDSDYVPLSQDIYEKYSIKSFVRNLLSL